MVLQSAALGRALPLARASVVRFSRQVSSELLCDLFGRYKLCAEPAYNSFSTRVQTSLCFSGVPRRGELGRPDGSGTGSVNLSLSGSGLNASKGISNMLTGLIPLQRRLSSPPVSRVPSRSISTAAVPDAAATRNASVDLPPGTDTPVDSDVQGECETTRSFTRWTLAQHRIGMGICARFRMGRDQIRRG